MSDLEAWVDSLFTADLSDNVGAAVVTVLVCISVVAWLVQKGRGRS